MSDDPEVRGEVQSEGEPVQQSEEQDWFLAQLVKWANKQTMKPNITLFLGGMLVSGTLISGKEYFNEFGDAIDTALSRRFGEKPTGEFRQPFSVLAGIYDEQTGDKDTDDPPPSYIHLRLRSIRICGAQRVRSETGILWRGRLSQVDGFFLGEIDE